jgi:hypothetical protein
MLSHAYSIGDGRQIPMPDAISLRSSFEMEDDPVNSR